MGAEWTREQLGVAILEQCRTAGCSCNPVVRVRYSKGRLHQASVRHEDGCKLLAAHGDCLTIGRSRTPRVPEKA